MNELILIAIFGPSTNSISEKLLALLLVSEITLAVNVRQPGHTVLPPPPQWRHMVKLTEWTVRRLDRHFYRKSDQQLDSLH